MIAISVSITRYKWQQCPSMEMHRTFPSRSYVVASFFPNLSYQEEVEAGGGRFPSPSIAGYVAVIIYAIGYQCEVINELDAHQDEIIKRIK